MAELVYEDQSGSWGPQYCGIPERKLWHAPVLIGEGGPSGQTGVWGHSGNKSVRGILICNVICKEGLLPWTLSEATGSPHG